MTTKGPRMFSLPQLAAALETTLIDLPTALGRATGFCRRRSKCTAAVFVQTLVLGWLAHPRGSLTQLTQTAAARGVTISPQGLDQRFGEPGAKLVEAVFADAVRQVVTADPVASTVLARFPAVLLLDSTTITLPDALRTLGASCGGRTATTPTAAVKLTVRLDLCRGGMEGPVLSAGRDQDKSNPLQHAPVPPGSLRIADLGFWSLAVLQTIRADGAHFLSRLHVGTTVADAATGQPLDVVAWLRRQPADQAEHAVTLGVAAKLPARLLAIRLSPDRATQRRRTIRDRAKRAGETPSKRLLERADWVLVVTSVPAEQLRLDEAMVMVRARWQIELLFKLWKSHGALDEWRSQHPHRIHCELFAKLIALIIQHWVILTGGWTHPDRSLVRQASIIRDHALLLALRLHRPRLLRRSLTMVVHRLAAARPLDRRQRHPSTPQLLLDPTPDGLA